MSEEDGTWMTLKQLKEAGSTLCAPTIRKIINSDGSFKKRRASTQGGPVEVLVTSENISRLRIRKELDFTKTELLERSASEVLVHTKSKDYQISANQEYSFDYFLDIVKSVLPNSGGSKAIEELFTLNAKRDGDSKKIDGSRLIGLLLESKKAVFIDSDLIHYLSGEAGVNVGEVGQALHRAAKEYIRDLSPNLHYIPRENLPEVIKLIRKDVYGVEDWSPDINLEEKNGKKDTAPEFPAEKVAVESVQPPKITGFYIEVPGILGAAKIFLESPGRTTSVREVINKTVGIEVIVDSEERTIAEKTSRYERILTAEELSEITGLHIATIRTRLKRYEKELGVRRRDSPGRAYEAKVTADNCELIGIKKEKAEQLFQTRGAYKTATKPTAQNPVENNGVKAATRKEPIAQETPIEIDISGRKYNNFPSRNYTPGEIGEILRQVHFNVFTQITVERVLKELESESGLDGRDLVRYISRVNGIMDLSSTGTRKKLTEIGVSAEDLRRDSDLSQYVRTAPGLREPYILKNDFLQIQRIISERNRLGRPTIIDPDDKDEKEIQTAIRNWDERLGKRKIMPREKILEKLVASGVLVLDSVSSINSSFGTFEREIKGFEYFDFNKVRMSIPGRETRWDEFHEKYMIGLIEAGIAKDIVQACGGSKDIHVYVMKEGTREEDIFRILDIKKAYRPHW